VATRLFEKIIKEVSVSSLSAEMVKLSRTFRAVTSGWAQVAIMCNKLDIDVGR
jgi:hypothetical protein